MSVKYKHSDTYSMYFCTFTCYNWQSLISITNSYDLVYSWFGLLRKKKMETIAYAIMPNHLHCILYSREPGFNLNMIIGNGKRFIAYEIVKRLEERKEYRLLDTLKKAVTERERKKGQVHKVFKESFDAKAIFTDKFLLQKLHYIHHNPVSGKWNLAEDFISYEHSSASFYEEGRCNHFRPMHYRDI